MTIPDYQALMLPVLRVAVAGEIRVPDAAEAIADELGLTAEERAQLLPSGRQPLLYNRVHWAKTYLTKAGLIESPGRGRFVATDEGKALIATNPARIDLATLKRYPAFMAFYAANRQATVPGEAPAAEAATSATATPEEQIDAAHAGGDRH